MIQIEDLFKSFNRGYLLGGMVKKTFTFNKKHNINKYKILKGI